MIPVRLVERFGPTVAKLIFWGVIVLVVIACAGVAKCTLDRGKKTEIELSKGQTGAAQSSGRDAVDTVGNQAASETEADRVTRENEDAIRSADGATAPVAGGVRDAGLDSLCRRAAYRSDPKCLQRAAPK